MMEYLTNFSLRDSILFSNEAYLSHVEIYYQTYWPAQIVIIGLNALLIFLSAKHDSWCWRFIYGFLALSWYWIGAIFHGRYMAPINWTAHYFSWLAYAQGVLMVMGGLAPPPISLYVPRRLTTVRLLGVVTLLYPMTLWILDHPLAALPLVGLEPDVTALATLVCLIPQPLLRRIGLQLPSLVWIAVSIAMASALDAKRCLTLTGFTLLVLAISYRPTRLVGMRDAA